MKAGVIGVGKLGGTIAYALARDGAFDHLVLHDVVGDFAWAQAEDLRHGMCGKVTVRSGGVADMADADLVVLCAGEGRKPGMSRLDLLRTNAPVVADLAREVGRVAPDAALVVLTNPLDVMTAVACKASGLPREKVLGSGALVDSVRLRALIADRLGVTPGDVDAVVLGEHGDRAVPLFSRAKVKGKPLRRNAARERDVFEALRGLSARVIAVKGSTTFGPAGCTAALARALFSDEPSVVPASVVLDGEYGLRGVALGVPVLVAKGRVVRVEEWPLSKDEREALREAGHDLEPFVAEATGEMDRGPPLERGSRPRACSRAF